ncbi:ribose 5-phosphate isomerase B [Candidatus Aerophobetes bacterium]|nr:ribose 5-phosphate isomerase B [Candidatus Aerophobetes bacterium]
MRIGLAADHGGYKLKEEIKNFLKDRKINYEDFGTYSDESTDYPDWGGKVAQAVADQKFDRGILICGTGLGMTIIANKFPGIRATPCYDIFTARLSRKHNNSNILVLGGRVTGVDLAKEIVKEWLTTDFDGGRHQRRINKIRQIEQRCFKEGSI